ncbi:tetratricopeptide repeat protein [Desulfovibrio psychrotolerans]|uniref:Tetratricopeptide repeat protein n=1 Tax=Desulfovibrio psychrotolerans TaxID=415242 RepID=A0A7J0BR19_9BACT|nr:tetratricopeptide repeat protein [Desulfovibrio psychrotolerans]GFM36129.1 hypothetical protein DSM19430T_08130 [Desulfovibrio psychrotolerans]
MDIDTFRGVHSTREADRTTKPHGGAVTRKRYWLVWDEMAESGTVTVQPLSAALEPAGAKRIITREEFTAQYTPEPGMVPSLARTQDADAGAREPAKGQAVSRSEHRQTIALDDLDFLDREAEMGLAAPTAAGERPPLDGPSEEKEREMRADFGMGLVYLKQGDSRKALRIFEKLLEERELVPGHKHMFTDFGISLRKSSLLEMALKHHLKVVELSGEDDHAHHNVARIYFELGDESSAVRYLKKSLELNPELSCSERFMRFIRKKRGGGGPIKLDM